MKIETEFAPTPRTDFVENGPMPNRAMPHLARDLERENCAMRQMLLRIAYPSRGTIDESAALQDFADEIQKTWTLEYLNA